MRAHWWWGNCGCARGDDPRLYVLSLVVRELRLYMVRKQRLRMARSPDRARRGNNGYAWGEELRLCMARRQSFTYARAATKVGSGQGRHVDTPCSGEHVGHAWLYTTASQFDGGGRDWKRAGDRTSVVTKGGRATNPRDVTIQLRRPVAWMAGNALFRFRGSRCLSVRRRRCRWQSVAAVLPKSGQRTRGVLHES